VPNAQAHVATVNFTTLPDTTPPKFQAGFPMVGDISETHGTVAVILDEPGQWWWLVTPINSVPPSVQQLRDGVVGSDSAALDHGWINATVGGALYNVTAYGLFPDAKYSAYIVAQDAMVTPNRQPVVTRVNFRAQCRFIPRVEIQGPALVDAFPSRGVSLVAVPKPAGCIGSDLQHEMVLFWEVVSTAAMAGVDGGGAFTLIPLSQRVVDAGSSSSDDVRTLQLPPADVRVGHVYTLRVTSWSLADPRANATATVTVRIVADLVVPVVNGVGGVRGFTQHNVNTSTVTVLDASQSRDLEATVHAPAAPLEFAWRCTRGDGQGACLMATGGGGGGSSVVFDAADFEVAGSRGAVLRLPPAALSLAPPSFGFTFMLTVTAGQPGRGIPLHHREAAMNVTLVPATQATAHAPAVVAWIVDTERVAVGGVVDAASPLQLAANASAAPGTARVVASMVWEPPVAVASALTTAGVSLHRAMLSIPGDVMQPGTPYTFTFRATDDVGTSSAASVVVVTNTPPHGGYVGVVPATGVASSTVFALSAWEWGASHRAVLPLRYRFSMVEGTWVVDTSGADSSLAAPASVPPRAELVSLTALSTSNATRTTLSDMGRVFAPGTNATITLVVHVVDALGTTTMSSVATTAAGSGAPSVAATVSLSPAQFNGTRMEHARSVAVDVVAAAALARDLDKAVAGMKESAALLTAGELSGGNDVDACDTSECGQGAGRGRCVAGGACVCTSGWGGAACDVALSTGGVGTVAGGWADWSEWSVCSMACGEGVQRRHRSCTSPPPGPFGTACAGATSDSRACFVASCTSTSTSTSTAGGDSGGDSGSGPPAVVDGGWGEWGPWQPCNATCVPGVPGVFPGWQHRRRTCSHPAPTPTGAPCHGDASQARECNTQPCPGTPARCPGSSGRTDAATGLPVVECSGFGRCVRRPVGCSASDPACSAWCLCDADSGRTGAACDVDAVRDDDTVHAEARASLLSSAWRVARQVADVGDVALVASGLRDVVGHGSLWSGANLGAALDVADTLLQKLDAAGGGVPAVEGGEEEALTNVLQIAARVHARAAGDIVVAAQAADPGATSDAAFQRAVGAAQAVAPKLHALVDKATRLVVSRRVASSGAASTTVGAGSGIEIVVGGDAREHLDALDLRLRDGTVMLQGVGQALAAAVQATGHAVDSSATAQVAAVVWSLDPGIATSANASIAAPHDFVYTPASTVVNVTAWLEGAPLPVASLATPIQVHIDLPSFVASRSAVCAYLNESSTLRSSSSSSSNGNSSGSGNGNASWTTWSMSGVAVRRDTSTRPGLVCSTSHLTAFSVNAMSQPLPSSRFTPRTGPRSSLLLSVVPPGTFFWFCTVLFVVVMCGLWVLACFRTVLRGSLAEAQEELFVRTGVLGRDSTKLPAVDKISTQSVLTTVSAAFSQRVRHEHSWVGLFAVRPCCCGWPVCLSLCRLFCASPMPCLRCVVLSRGCVSPHLPLHAAHGCLLFSFLFVFLLFFFSFATGATSGSAAFDGGPTCGGTGHCCCVTHGRHLLDHRRSQHPKPRRVVSCARRRPVQRACLPVLQGPV